MEKPERFMTATRFSTSKMLYLRLHVRNDANGYDCVKRGLGFWFPKSSKLNQKYANMERNPMKIRQKKLRHLFQYENEKYWKSVETKSGKTYWYCCQRFKCGCKARLVTRNGEVMDDSKNSHNHKDNQVLESSELISPSNVKEEGCLTPMQES